MGNSVGCRPRPYTFAVQPSRDETTGIVKMTNEDEVTALEMLTLASARRVPVLLRAPVRKGKKYRIVIANKGQSLDTIGGRRNVVGGKALVLRERARLEADLRAALTECWNAGIRHLDLPSRGQTNPKNITWDGFYFNVIDFDKVEFSQNWNVEAELQEIMVAVTTWANSRDEYGRLPGSR
jgi:hypothetical protein